ncbi:50S ribosomal protein L17 [Phosphitispora sp. TUW77]|uniref:50S ribosomal protein L17 n=1 Tax=Phosphitispora sp. TUW77 TaxID=3152361 RepID=UPI003AB2EA96
MAFPKLGLRTDHRKALVRNMVTSLLREERVQTTAARARSVSRVTEKMITLAKRGDLHARRQAMQLIYDEDVVKKLFDVLATKYADRQGGYTRIIKVGQRRGDAAEMVILELV